MTTERPRFRHRPVPIRPLRELEEWGRRLDEEFARPFMRAIWDRVPEEEKGWAAPIELFEKGDTIIAKIELPGVKQADIDLSVSDDVLTVKGEKKMETAVREEDYIRSEIDYGTFHRSIALPPGIDAKNVDAVYEDGVLRVTLHRAAEAKPKKINIQVKKED